MAETNPYLALGATQVGENQYTTLGAKLVASNPYDELGAKPVNENPYLALGATQVKPGFLEKAKDVAMDWITPDPLLAKAREAIAAKSEELMGAARPDILTAPATASPITESIGAVRSSLIPLPSQKLARAYMELSIPASKLELLGTVASPVLGFLFKKLLPPKAVAIREGTALEVPTVPVQPGTLEEQVSNVIDLTKKANSEGISPVVIMTDSEKAIYSRFKPQIQSSIEFRTPINALIAKEELAAFDASKTTLESMFNKQVADAAIPRIAALPPDDLARNISELSNARKNGLSIPIKNESSRETLEALIERQARPRIDSEQNILGLDQTTEAMRQTANQAILDARAGKPIAREAQDQVMVAVSESILNGEFSPEVGAKLLGIPELASASSRAEMAKVFLETSSKYGKGLAQLSRIARTMETVFGHEPEVKAVFDAAKKAGEVKYWSIWNYAMDAYRYLDNFRKASMLSGIGTTVRNIVSQGERSVANIWEDAVSGTLGVARGRIGLKEASKLVQRDIEGFVNALSPKGKKAIDDILSQFPLEQEKLLNAPIGDVSLGSKATRLLNTFNTYQEMFYRRVSFDARIRQTMDLTGKTITELTEPEIQDAVRHSLEMTYSETPKEGLGKVILSAYREVPILTSLGNTFPRFWLNAIKRLHSMSLAPLFSGKFYADLASKDPRIAGAALGKMSTGIGYAGAGYALAEMGKWGEKWYEVKHNGKYYDMRPYAPVITPLFVGRMIHDIAKEGPDALLRLTSDDWIQATLSMKRTDATGIPLMDIAFSRSEKERADNVIRTFASYASSFVPRIATTARDVVGMYSQPERLPRYTKEQPITAGIISQFPFWSRNLPISPSLMRAEPEERIDTGMRALGFIARIKTPAEVEADKIGIQVRNIYPHTGSKEYDRIIVERLGPIAQVGLGNIMATKEYMTQSRKVKKAIFETYLSKFESVSKNIARSSNEKFNLHDMVQNKDKIVRELIKESFDKQGIEYEFQ